MECMHHVYEVPTPIVTYSFPFQVAILDEISLGWKTQTWNNLQLKWQKENMTRGEATFFTSVGWVLVSFPDDFSSLPFKQCLSQASDNQCSLIPGIHIPSPQRPPSYHEIGLEGSRGLKCYQLNVSKMVLTPYNIFSFTPAFIKFFKLMFRILHLPL